MKILLVGEYSRLHTSLKEGLTHWGHDVTIIGAQDGFKKFQVDLCISPTFFETKYFIFLNKIIYKLIKIEIRKLIKGILFYFHLSKLKKFDHVQFINSDAIGTYPFITKYLFKKLLKNIPSRSLLICGDETPIIDFQFKNELKYSILTPYFQNNSLKNKFRYSLKYRDLKYRKIFSFLEKNCKTMIASDLDYKIPMVKMNYPVHFIPNPINIDKLIYKKPEIDFKIVIFLGINLGSSIKKGSDFFEKALAIVEKKYGDTIEIITTRNVPYDKYITLYDKAHILLDQVYSYDQGYNALEAMAKGKVVFTGAENEFLKHYNLKADEVCINAIPDEIVIAKKLSFLIENPQMIVEISQKARQFIEREHDYKKIAQQYLNTWTGIF